MSDVEEIRGGRLLVEALRDLQASDLQGKKHLQWVISQSFWSGHMARTNEPVSMHQRIIDRAARGTGCGRGADKVAMELRKHGAKGKSLANKVSKLSTARNVISHPDVFLEEDVMQMLLTGPSSGVGSSLNSGGLHAHDAGGHPAMLDDCGEGTDDDGSVGSHIAAGLKHKPEPELFDIFDVVASGDKDEEKQSLEYELWLTLAHLSAVCAKQDELQEVDNLLKVKTDELQNMDELLKIRLGELQGIDNMLKDKTEELRANEDLLKFEQGELQEVDNLLKDKTDELQANEELLMSKRVELRDLTSSLESKNGEMQGTEADMVIKGLQAEMASLETKLMASREIRKLNANQIELMEKNLSCKDAEIAKLRHFQEQEQVQGGRAQEAEEAKGQRGQGGQVGRKGQKDQEGEEGEKGGGKESEAGRIIEQEMSMASMRTSMQVMEMELIEAKNRMAMVIEDMAAKKAQASDDMQKITHNHEAELEKVGKLMEERRATIDGKEQEIQDLETKLMALKEIQDRETNQMELMEKSLSCKEHDMRIYKSKVDNLISARAAMTEQRIKELKELHEEELDEYTRLTEKRIEEKNKLVEHLETELQKSHRMRNSWHGSRWKK